MCWPPPKPGLTPDRFDAKPNTPYYYPVMHCRRCRVKMRVDAHRPHKQEKWRCPQCRAVRMKPAAYRRQKPLQ